jgi:anti-sigma factor RsiW
MQQLNHSADCISNLELDEWHAGELSAEDQQRAALHVAQCPRCRSRREALERERAAFFAAAPTLRDHARQLERVLRPARRVSRLAIGAAAVAASLAAVAGLMLLPTQHQAATRAKGEPHLGFFIKRDQQITRGANGATVHPDDFIRFVYSSDHSYYFALFNLDAHAATVYFPGHSEAARVFAGNDVPLDFSVQLDDQLGAERVVALFCPDAFAVEPVRARMASGELPIPAAGCHRDVITLKKVARK